MSLRYKDLRGEEFPLNVQWIIEDSKTIVLLTDSRYNLSSRFEYPMQIIDKQEKYSESRIFLFKNKFYSKEDHCFNIKIENKRCGVIFPIKVFNNSNQLPDPETDKSTNFFYRFLYIAFYHLINDESIPTRAIDFDKLSNNEFNITDFFDEETNVLLYHDIVNPVIDIKCIYPSLFRIGYVSVLASSDFSEIDMVILEPNKHPFYEFNFLDSISLKPSKTTNERFVELMFTSILKYHLNPVAKFILLYQVIELFIDKIAFEHFQNAEISVTDISSSLEEINNEKSYRNISSKLKKIQQELESSIAEIKKEETRIRILVNEKCKLQLENYSQFALLSQKIIGSLHNCPNLHEFIYQLRNKIVHDYHNLTVEHNEIENDMESINFEFERLVSDIVIEFE